MLFGVSRAAAKLFKSVISAGWQQAMSVRLTKPSMLFLSTTGSFFNCYILVYGYDFSGHYVLYFQRYVGLTCIF